VLQHGGVVVEGVEVDPVVDALAGDAEHAGDVGGGAAVVKLQDGEGAPEESRVAGLGQLLPEALPLPGS
jgi:hypothetical protein